MTTCRIRTSINTNVKNATVYAVAFGTSQTTTDVKNFVRSRMYNPAFIRNYPDTIVSMYSEATSTRYHSGKGHETFRGQLSYRVDTATGYMSPVEANVQPFAGDTLVSNTHVYVVLADGIHKTNLSVSKIFTGSLAANYQIVDGSVSTSFSRNRASMDVTSDILNNSAGNVYYYTMAFTKQLDITEHVLDNLSLANAVSAPMTVGTGAMSTETTTGLANVVDNVNNSVFPVSAVNAAYVYAIVSTANVASDITSIGRTFDIDSNVLGASDPSPHLDIRTGYWSRFYNHGVLNDSSVFSSLANIVEIYPPVAFTTDQVDVENTDTNTIVSFITGNVNPIMYDAARQSVSLLNSTLNADYITRAHKDLTDFNNVENMVEDGAYSIVLTAKDVMGRFGIGKFVGKPTFSIREVNWDLTPNDPVTNLNYSTNIKNIQIKACSLSAEGDTIVVSGDNGAHSNGNAFVWKYNQGTQSWGKYDSSVEGGFSANTAYVLKNSSISTNPTRINYGESNSISANGNTVLISGSLYGSNGGKAYVWQYNQDTHEWGKYTTGGFVPNTPYELSKLELGVGFYGQRCSLSADGQTALVSGVKNDSYNGIVLVWQYDSQTKEWGKYDLSVDGGFLEGTAHDLSTSSGTTIRAYGKSCSISGDGKTALVTGSNLEYIGGDAFVWDYNSDTHTWGKYSAGGGFIAGTPHNLSLSSDCLYGESCSISMDGKTVVVAGRLSGSNGGRAFVWQYNSTTRTWGRFDVGGFVAGTPHDLSKSTGSSINGYGESCSISADGKTVIVSGNNNSTISGAAYLWQYNQDTKMWGKYNVNGVFTNNTPHNLSKSYTSVYYGRSCSISANGKIALVSRKLNVNYNIGTYVWVGDDNGNRATVNYEGTEAISNLFVPEFTLKATIAAATFNTTNGNVEITGSVVASDTGTTDYFALATTNPTMSPDQVRSLVQAGSTAVVPNANVSAGVVTIPSVMDITGNVFVSSAVNYAHVYLYGTDSVSTTHDALDLNIIQPIDPNPYIDIRSAYWSNLKGGGVVDDSSVFSSLANIVEIYPPEAFTSQVNLATTDTNALISFITGNVVPITFHSVKYSVGLLNDVLDSRAIQEAHTDLITFSNVETMYADNTYSVVILAKDITGNVGIGKLIGETLSASASRISVRKVNWGSITEESPNYNLSKISETNGRYGLSCAISADGQTAIVAGYASNVSGGAWVWQYDNATQQWGVDNEEGGRLPNHNLSKLSGTNGEYGRSCAISADGKTVIVTGPYNNTSGGAWVWRYDKDSQTWGVFDIDVTLIPNHDLSKLSETNGEYGYSCAISEDGKTVIVAGPYDNTSGGAWIWQYDEVTQQWGVDNDEGGRSPNHNLSKLSGTNGEYGKSCSISADGKTAIVAGPYNNTSGGAWVWNYDEVTQQWGVDNVDGGRLPNHNLSKVSGTNGEYGKSCAISADGKTVIVAGPYNNTSGGAWVWKYDESSQSWGVFGDKSSPTLRSPNHNLSKLSGTNGEYGISCSISADGKTVVVAGYDETYSNGGAWVWKYAESSQQYGVPDVASGRAPNHNLSKTLDINAWYGQSCSISADGRSILVAGQNPTTDEGVAYVWVGNDLGQRVLLNYDGTESITSTIFVPLSTLKTTISTADIDTNGTLQITGNVVASDTGTTSYYALATTNPTMSPDQVRSLIQAGSTAIVSDANVSAGAVTIPNVIDLTGNVFASSAVNYVRVYLYGTDTVDERHDALDANIINTTDLNPYVQVTVVSSVSGGSLTFSGTVFSSVANISTVKAAAFPSSYDLDALDQANLASFVHTNGTDLSLTSVRYAVGNVTGASLSTYFSGTESGYTTSSLVSGNIYKVAMTATDTTGNIGVGHLYDITFLNDQLLFRINPMESTSVISPVGVTGSITINDTINGHDAFNTITSHIVTSSVPYNASHNYSVAIVIKVSNTIGTWGSIFEYSLNGRDFGFTIESKSTLRLIGAQTNNLYTDPGWALTTDPVIMIATMQNGTLLNFRVYDISSGTQIHTATLSTSKTVLNVNAAVLIGKSSNVYPEKSNSTYGEVFMYSKVLTVQEESELVQYLLNNWS